MSEDIQVGPYTLHKGAQQWSRKVLPGEMPWRGELPSTVGLSHFETVLLEEVLRLRQELKEKQ